MLCVIVYTQHSVPSAPYTQELYATEPIFSPSSKNDAPAPRIRFGIGRQEIQFNHVIDYTPRRRETHLKKSWLIRIPIILLLAIWTLFPVYWMLSLSIRSGAELTSSLSFFPQSFTFEHFTELFGKFNFGQATMNSLKITTISLLISLAFGLCCAYILARRRFYFRLRGTMLFSVILVRVLPPIAFALPLYIMMNQMGILGTQLPIMLAHILINLPFIIWFMISFFANVPVELEESAKIDGANEWQSYIRIVLPLVAPGITAAAILSFMTSWNEYLYGAIFVQSPSNFTIPLALATMNSEQELAQWGSIAAGGVISMIPVMLFVVLAQNFLIQGLSSGAVKE